MKDLTQVLKSSDLDRLREHYDGAALATANARAFSEVYPPLARWGETAASLFFRDGPLAARERELCLIALLSFRATTMSLSNHIYWGLMEGLTVAEICEAIGLAGCYGGLPAYGQGMVVLQRTLDVLQRVAADDDRRPPRVLAALVEAFANVSI